MNRALVYLFVQKYTFDSAIAELNKCLVVFISFRRVGGKY
jgi:hypothetical protein